MGSRGWAVAVALTWAAARPGVAADFPLPYRFDYPRTYLHEGTFPDGFLWGLGTSSYQIEGAWNESGKGPSIWDVFTGAAGGQINPGMQDGYGQTGAVACDHYHHFKEDVELMKRLGLKAYRFSISWARLLPNGTLAESGGEPNKEGIAFYNKLIDALIAASIEPIVTLYHWDLPQALLDDAHHGFPSEYRGWLDERMPSIFAEYASICFDAFGDRVRHWYTFNEPWTFLVQGYGGQKAPSLCNWDKVKGCTGGKRPSIGYDVYVAGHHVLLAHAEAVRLYRASYQADQKGLIGIANNCDWKEPGSDRPEDVDAAQRTLEFELGWFADPIFRGDYPPSMRAVLGARLPSFTGSQKEMLNGSADMFGLNHYSSRMTVAAPPGPAYGTAEDPYSYWRDRGAKTYPLEGWPLGNSSWLYSVPWGLRKLLRWVHLRYGGPPVYILENGDSVGAGSAFNGTHDPSRIAFLANYTSEMHKVRCRRGLRRPTPARPPSRPAAAAAAGDQRGRWAPSCAQPFVGWWPAPVIHPPTAASPRAQVST